MNTKIVTTVRNGLLLLTITAAAHTRVIASDVIGDRAKIGDNNGSGQSLTGTGSSIAGGDGNTLNADYSTIAGGLENLITNSPDGYVFIGGGAQNIASNDLSVVVGGNGNYVYSYGSFIGGGAANGVLGSDSGGYGYSAIVGGYNNTITSNNCFIGGGGYNTAASYYDVIAGGYFNTNTGENATIGGGAYNLAEGDYSTIAGGVEAVTANYGQSAYASGTFDTYPVLILGEAQASEFVLRNISTGTNSTELFLDGSSLRMVLPANGTWSYDVLVSVRETNGNSGGFHTTGVIKKHSGTTTMVGGVNPINVPPIAADVASWKVSVSADNSDGALAVKVNGDTSTNRWVATVRTTEVKY